MAFQSLHDLAKKSRKSTGKTYSQASSVAVTQAYYAERDTCILTIRISSEGMEKSRLKRGDKVDVLHDPESGSWKIKIITEGKGYAISSGSTTSQIGVVRFTHYDGMPLIADRTSRKVRSFGPEDSIIYAPGEITFALTNPEQDDSV